MSAYKNHFKKQRYGTVYLRNIRNPKNSMNYFTVAWPDSGTRLWIFFIQCQYARTILRKKNMRQSLFKKHSKFLNFNEVFSCGMTAWPNACKNNNFLEHIFTQELLSGIKLWDKIILENVLDVKVSAKYFNE